MRLDVPRRKGRLVRVDDVPDDATYPAYQHHGEDTAVALAQRQWSVRVRVKRRALVLVQQRHDRRALGVREHADAAGIVELRCQHRRDFRLHVLVELGDDARAARRLPFPGRLDRCPHLADGDVRSQLFALGLRRPGQQRAQLVDERLVLWSVLEKVLVERGEGVGDGTGVGVGDRRVRDPVLNPVQAGDVPAGAGLANLLEERGRGPLAPVGLRQVLFSGGGVRRRLGSLRQAAHAGPAVLQFPQ